MTQYLGVKKINAVPMTRLEYNNVRGWKLLMDEKGDDEGYLVEYSDPANKPNVEGYSGYVSWSPKDVFDYTFRRVSARRFP